MFQIKNIESAYKTALRFIRYPCSDISKYINDTNNNRVSLKLDKNNILSIVVLVNNVLSKHFKAIYIGNLDDLVLNNFNEDIYNKDYNNLFQTIIFQHIEKFNKEVDILEDIYDKGGLIEEGPGEISLKKFINNNKYGLTVKNNCSIYSTCTKIIDKLSEIENSYIELITFIEDIKDNTGYDFWSIETDITKRTEEIIRRYKVMYCRSVYEREKLFKE